MLKSWSIDNFKPIVTSGDLKLAPVTILAGRNSSGKSSLLQSILMIAQTLSSKVVDRPLLPTGLNVQLGTFDDILSTNSSSRNVTVGFEMEFETDQDNTKDKDIRFRSEADVRSIKVNAVFNSASSASTSAIEAAKVVVESVCMDIDDSRFLAEKAGATNKAFDTLEAMDFRFSFDIEKLNEEQLQHFLERVSTEHLRLVPYVGEQANYIGRFKHQNEKAEQTVLVHLSHFLPTRFVRKFREEERRLLSLKRLLRSILRRITSRLSSAPDKILYEILQQYSDVLNPDALLAEEAKIAINDFYEQLPFEPKMHLEQFSGQTLFHFILWLRHVWDASIPPEENLFFEDIAFYPLMLDVVDNCAHASLNTDLGDPKDSEGLEIVVNDSYIESISQAVTRINRFFTSKIRYLGPLRADPQASQKFAPSSELDDVGARGEYAAAVYDANQQAKIEWFNPLTEKVEQGTLSLALDSWVRYLDVANQIKIETAGQSGFSWQVVHKKGRRPLPLSSVGVGVSQVLPILVMGLLAPRDTLLIVEQPELHLHPHVQARLGDFFVGLSRCKKQCLIETHSENLVSQLRYHIVQAGGLEKSDCIIYFVDQDSEGAARFEPVQISPQGNILNWPEGFFDETMLQEDRITAASIKKRAKQTGNG
jgi:predicted ATPase